jgi:hypothetical protein
VAIIVAIVLAANKKKKERDRVRATELREQAATQASGLQQREARARETEAEAAAARAEADRKQAEAERLAAQADDHHRSAGAAREEHEEHLRRADELDPDVNTKGDDYTGPGTERGGDSQDTQAGYDDRSSSQDATITHPDGSTEQVTEPVEGHTDPETGGSHRA